MEPSFTNPSQIGEGEHGDEREPDEHAVFVELGQEARDRSHARGRRHRNGQDVVDQQCRGRDEPRDDAVVLARDEIAPATVRIRADDSRLREHDDREDAGDRDRDGHGERERGSTRHGEDPHGLAPAVGFRLFAGR